MANRKSTKGQTTIHKTYTLNKRSSNMNPTKMTYLFPWFGYVLLCLTLWICLAVSDTYFIDMSCCVWHLFHWYALLCLTLWICLAVSDTYFIDMSCCVWDLFHWYVLLCLTLISLICLDVSDTLDMSCCVWHFGYVWLCLTLISLICLAVSDTYFYINNDCFFKYQ